MTCAQSSSCEYMPKVFGWTLGRWYDSSEFSMITFQLQAKSRCHEPPGGTGRLTSRRPGRRSGPGTPRGSVRRRRARRRRARRRWRPGTASGRSSRGRRAGTTGRRGCGRCAPRRRTPSRGYWHFSRADDPRSALVRAAMAGCVSRRSRRPGAGRPCCGPGPAARAGRRRRSRRGGPGRGSSRPGARRAGRMCSSSSRYCPSEEYWSGESR